ncbi:MAG: sugar ABC transporter permease [Microlunatus sp.]|nr:sugar ABC transporter permease [Microlunatus sp.]
MAVTEAPVAPAATAAGRRPGRSPGERGWIAAIFLLPAVVFLGAIVFYPLIYTLIRSFFSDGPTGRATGFAGLGNYIAVFTAQDSLQAFENNIIWVIVVPAVVTILGLFFAVLTERIKWGAAFKIILFMPMAISFLASGVTWTLIYVDNPSRGLANSVVIGVHDIFSSQRSFPELHPKSGSAGLTGDAGHGYTTAKPVTASEVALLPLTGFNLTAPPPGAQPAVKPAPGHGLSGVVWNDFKLGGGGTSGAVDQGELGVPGIKVEAVRGGTVAATTTTAANGTFQFTGLAGGSYQVRLPSQDFTAAFQGVSWLGRNLITPSIIVAYLWIYAGFAMVLLAAGMSTLPRDVLEAARIDGASEWRVFRLITVPLLSPVLLVVFVTMLINVLKIFDIVFIIQQAAGGDARYANVLAVQLYTDYGNQQFGGASAIGIILVLLVIPAMIFQIRRFRRDER